MRSLEGEWWGNSLPKFRVIDLGLDDHPLVARTMDGAWIEPVTWNFDSEQKVADYRVAELYDVFIRMKTIEAPSILRSMAIEEKRPVHPRTDFALLYDTMEAAKTP